MVAALNVNARFESVLSAHIGQCFGKFRLANRILTEGSKSRAYP